MRRFLLVVAAVATVCSVNTVLAQDINYNSGQPFCRLPLPAGDAGSTADLYIVDAGTCTGDAGSGTFQNCLGLCRGMAFGAVWELQCWGGTCDAPNSTALRINYSAQPSGEFSDAGLLRPVRATLQSQVVDFGANSDPRIIYMPRNGAHVSVLSNVAGCCYFYPSLRPPQR